MRNPARTAISQTLLVTSSLLALPFAAAPAVAAAPANAASTGSESDTGLAEIVVTAQRKSEGVLSVPMSIEAESGQQLLDSGIKTSTDLELVTPGFLVSDSVGYTQIYIRGVGNSIFVGADPSVATYIDDVPRIYGSNLANFVNVDRVEVLKGAQGGLYGRNATGGVVNVITQQPTTDKFSAVVRGSYGEKGTYTVAGTANIPVTDKVALNLAIEHDAHDPYINNTASDAPYTAAMFPGGSAFGNAATTAAFLNSGVNAPSGFNRQDFSAGSGKLLIMPLDNLKITLAGDYSHKADDNGNGFRDVTPAFNQANVVGFLGSIGAHPVLPAGFIQGSTSNFTSSQGIDGTVSDLDYGESGTVVWSLPGVDLTSITADRVNNTHLLTELGGTTVPLLEADVSIHREYFYQELRGVSTFDGPWQFLGGATYLQTHFSALTFFDLFHAIATPLAATVDAIENWSVYAQGGYDLTHALNLTVSGRYVHENNLATYSIPPTPAASSLSEDKFLPSATLSYKFDQGGNVYARWARGFKSGGINPTTSPTQFPDPQTQGGIFAGEQVDTYEIGARAPLFDHSLEVTSAVFYNDYKNLQASAHSRPAFPQVILAIVNAGTARTYGVEGGINWRVIQPLTVGVNAGYLNAKYKSFDVPASNPILEPFNLSGQRMPNSPTAQYSFTGNLDQPILDGKLHLIGSALVSYVSQVIFIQSGLPGVLPDAIGPSYWLANLRAGVKTPDDKIEVVVYANNVGNSVYYTYGSSAASTGTILNWGNPRIVGGEVTLRF
jgi:iron complex outermembrane receptor protein